MIPAGELVTEDVLADQPLRVQIPQVTQLLDLLERLQVGDLAAQFVELRADLPAKLGLRAGGHRPRLAQRASAPRSPRSGSARDPRTNTPTSTMMAI